MYQHLSTGMARARMDQRLQEAETFRRVARPMECWRPSAAQL
jgi:hypothetical protein